MSFVDGWHTGWRDRIGCRLRGRDGLYPCRSAGRFVRQVVGIDSTQEMVDKARRNAEESGFANAQFWQADVTHLPVASESIDAVISNGVFNLCLHKARVLSEVFRVLKAGGRLHMADVMLENHVTPEKVRLMGSWSG